jgi:two-component system sensor histidine kinase HydH
MGDPSAPAVRKRSARARRPGIGTSLASVCGSFWHTVVAARREERVVWEQQFLDELCAYTGFKAEHAATLRAIAPYVRPQFNPIVDRFYDAIFKTPRAAAVLTGGMIQVERQKALLRDWLAGLVGGVYDVEYLRLRARIGRTHVRIRLEQRYMFSAMNIVRTGLHEALADAPLPPEQRRLAHDAVDKICDLELAIMLETYSEDHLQRMRDNERLATLGQLSGFIGHELRNPLAVMETSIHLLKRRLPVGDERAGRQLQRLREQVSLASGIISDLLELARDRPIERLPVDDLAELIRASAGEVPAHGEVEIAIELPSELPPPRIDEKQIRRLLVNLITNACQALEGKSDGRIVVGARRDADKLLLYVDDNGSGIADEVRYRLFEPLATTRAKGLGLGLALCRRIAEKHDGEIRALASARGGARFEVRLGQAFEAEGNDG